MKTWFKTDFKKKNAGKASYIDHRWRWWPNGDHFQAFHIFPGWKKIDLFVLPILTRVHGQFGAGQFGAGQFGAGTIWCGDNLVPDNLVSDSWVRGQFGVGQFGVGTIWCRTIWCRTVRCQTIWCRTVRCDGQFGATIVKTFMGAYLLKLKSI